MKRLLLFLGVLLASAPAFADRPRENVSDVVAAAQQAALAIAPPQSSVTVSQANGAKYMPVCVAPLAVTITGNAPYQEAAVRCAAPPWSLYVTVTVAEHQPVEVAAHNIVAGQTLSASDIQVVDKPVSMFAGRQTFAGPQMLIGTQATMSLPAGTVITSDAVSQPVAVNAGQTVSVLVIDGGITVTVNAVAGATGRIGDTVLMTNPSSGRRFSALLTAQGPEVQLGQ